MAAKELTFEGYLAGVSAKQRLALEKVRQAIQAAAPEAVEGTSYGLPALILHGKPLAALSASAHHCSLFPMSGHVVAALEGELKGFDTSKGTIRFTPEKPLPATLVRKVVKARMAEIAAKAVKKPPAAKSRKPARKTTSHSPTDEAVEAFLKDLKHPRKKEILEIRKIILGVDPAIREGIKWNAPSFALTDFFATVNLRSTSTVQVIFHTGAKVSRFAQTGLSIDDPSGLIQWLAKDRCMVTLGKGREVTANRKALADIVRQWINHLR